MLEQISEEAYKIALEKETALKKEMFDIRFASAIVKDANELKQLEDKYKIKRLELARTKVIIKTYELENNIENKKRGK